MAALSIYKKSEEFLNEIEKQEVTIWKNQMRQWEKENIYHTIAHMILLPKRGIHVDFASGMGNFVAKIAHLYPESVFFAIDSNRYMLRQSQMVFDTFRLDHNLFTHSDYGIISENGFHSTWGKIFMLPQRKDMCVSRSEMFELGVINLVADSIMDLSVASNLLGRRKISSASLLFFQSSERCVYEHPFYPFYENTPKTSFSRKMRRSLSEEEVYDRRILYEDLARFSFLRFLSRKMKYGGKVYVASVVKDVEAFKKDALHFILGFKKYWDHEASLSLLGANIHPQTYAMSQASIVIQVFKRNKIRYTKEKNNG